jgi:hypothetical protein
MIRVSLDWEDAREQVEQDEGLQDLVRSMERDLQDYVNRDGVDQVKRYLPTHYFDNSGYRYSSLLEDAGTWPRKEVVDAMHRASAAKIAQERIFGVVEANNAFERWVVGDHDT